MCGVNLFDKGRIENYLGPYSAYEEQTVFETQENKIIGEGYCWHKAVCPSCKHEQLVIITCKLY